MSPEELIERTLAEHTAVVELFRKECSATVAEMAAATIESLENGGKICFCGNGGSAADAQHFATEFTVRFARNRKALAAIAFTTDTSTLTACANDFGFDAVFERQAMALCRPGDILVGISTSGKSPNIVRALQWARGTGTTTFAFTGADGGDCTQHADKLLAVPSPVTARAQECHLVAGHMLCDIVERHFADTDPAIYGN